MYLLSHSILSFFDAISWNSSLSSPVIMWVNYIKFIQIFWRNKRIYFNYHIWIIIILMWINLTTRDVTDFSTISQNLLDGICDSVSDCYISSCKLGSHSNMYSWTQKCCFYFNVNKMKHMWECHKCGHKDIYHELFSWIRWYRTWDVNFHLNK